MKILLITNDFFDAKTSRLRLKEWLLKNKGSILNIASNKEKFGINEYQPDVVMNKPVLSLKNIKKINKEIIQYNVIIYRGIECVILSLLLKNKTQKNIFLITGLGKLCNDDKPFSNFFKYIYRNIIKFCMICNKALLIVQNKQDKVDLKLNARIINGSGYPNVECKRSFNTLNIVTATRLTRAKGLNQIIKMAEIIANGDHNINYYILGDYSELNTTYKNKISELNKSERVFFEGFVSNTGNYLKFCDFAFFPSNYREGVPRFLIESLAHGLIIFTKSAPGCSKTVSNQNGFLNMSQTNIIKTIIKMSTQEKKFMSKNSKELFLSTYEENIVFEEYYKCIIN